MQANDTDILPRAVSSGSILPRLCFTIRFIPTTQEPDGDGATKDLQRKLQQKQDELDMLQIANETLQAQCKVSTTSNPKPTPHYDGNPGEECVRSAEWRARVLRPARPDCRLTLSPIIERTQAAVEREEEIKEAMNDALGASQRRITDLEGELEHALRAGGEGNLNRHKAGAAADDLLNLDARLLKGDA